MPLDALGWAFTLPAPLLTAFGAVRMLLHTWRRVAWTRVDGEVVGWEDGPSGGSDGHDISNPVIGFTTLDGHYVECRRLAWDIGIYTMSRVKVWYDPSRPRRFAWKYSWSPYPGVLPLVSSLPLWWLAIG